MGKPFDSELGQLEKTYRWALEADISTISDVLKSSWSTPLLSVGSGGSFSAAEFQVLLHRHYFSSVSHAVTPVELISALPRSADAAIWLMSASGNNIDIYRAFQHVALHEMKFVNAIVGRKNSKVNKLSVKYEYTNCFEHPLPQGKDGFLATNSLLAFIVILHRAYASASNRNVTLPNTIKNLIERSLENYKSLNQIEKIVAPLWTKKSLHILYSVNLKPAAFDIESKFTEAGLISTHLADTRNFAHGRHHWFSKHGEDSGILALSIKKDYEVVQKTLDLLPDSIPKAHISFKELECAEAISAMIISMYLTSWLGMNRGIDPGRPGVPAYGSKIYRLTANPGFVNSINKEEIAIKRKRKLAPSGYDKKSEELWREAYRRFTKYLSAMDVGGIVLDYDGTVVDSDKRWDPPSNDIRDEIVRILESGVRLGFATGRGKSIRADLQKVIPKKYWNRVIIGYYNGSEIKELSDNRNLSSAQDPTRDLKLLYKKIKNNIFLSKLAKFDQKGYQLTVKRDEDSALSETFLWDLVQDEFYKYEPHKGEVLRSSHSIDIIALNISKLSVVEEIKKAIGDKSKILTIGDRGRWPGNDASLLKESLSLSVDEVSYSPDTCWNLCPAGVRGAQGTLYYFQRLKIRNNGTLKFVL